MKHFIDGDQVAVTLDDFVDLHDSPALFFPRSSKTGRTIEKDGILGLPFGELRAIKQDLESAKMYNKAV